MIKDTAGNIIPEPIIPNCDCGLTCGCEKCNPLLNNPMPKSPQKKEKPQEKPQVKRYHPDCGHELPNEIKVMNYSPDDEFCMFCGQPQEKPQESWEERLEIVIDTIEGIFDTIIKLEKDKEIKMSSYAKRCITKEMDRLREIRK